MSIAVGELARSTAERRDRLVDRILDAAAGTFDVFAIYLGDRLGFYEALTDQGTLTSSQLASATGAHERYVREWLEQQTVTGILQVENQDDAPLERRYFLPSGHDEVLADRESLNFLAPLAQLLAGAVRPLDSVAEAYRVGGGVSFKAYGRDLREGQARINRAMFLQQLGQEWIPAIPAIHGRLQKDPPARIADIGCGAGWSSIGFARSYPKVRVDGLDLDRSSIEEARRNASEAAVDDRVRFFHRDAEDPQLAGEYDLVMAIECIHDLSQPVAVLDGMRRMVKKEGSVLVVDERVGDKFTATGDEIEWMMYGWSILHCLPVGMADEPSACTGTVMRVDTLRRYALEAGFSEVEVLPIKHVFFRFYRLC